MMATAVWNGKTADIDTRSGFWASGHVPTLIAAFLYFDFAFMVWVLLGPLAPEIAKTLDLSVKQGVLITGVVQNGPASEGGLRPGDVVLRIEGTTVTSTPQLLNAVAALKPRETATIGVQRGDTRLDVKVKVGQRPPSRPVQPER